MEALFRPFKLKSLQLKNRIAMAPMTRYFSPGGVPTPDVAEYYRRRAAGGTGLIITEGAGIDRKEACRDPDVPVLYGEEALAGWRDVIDAVHAAGAAVAPQLWHVGASPPRIADRPECERESPSGLFGQGIERGRAMSDADIADTIDAYARAAAESVRLGSDAVELHGAHGYLIDQFFWDVTNRRGDRYGGAALAERTRFAADIVRAVRCAVGEDIAILFRLSQWKIPNFDAKNAASPGELEQWLAPLNDAGVDIYHCSQRRFWEPEFAGSALNLAGWVKKLSGRPTITVGSVGLAGEFLSPKSTPTPTAPIDDLVERLEREEFDLVAVGRALISDPAWADKIRDGRNDDVRAFDPEDMRSLA